MLASAVLALGLANLTSAHECWLAPSTWSPRVGDDVGLSLLIGHVGDVHAVPRRVDHLERFRQRTPAGTIADVPGTIGWSPVGVLESVSAGLHVVAYEGRWMHTQLAAERFDGYLKEKGLEWVREERTHRGEEERPGAERYRRACVALLRVGGEEEGTSGDPVEGGADSAVSTDLGAALASLELPVAIVPVTDPALYAAGATVVYEVRSGAGPLTDVLVTARALARDAGRPQQARTDDQGRVRFALDRAGAWLVDAVTMQRAPEGATAPEDHGTMPGATVDWESTWASLTFVVAPPPAATEAAATADQGD